MATHEQAGTPADTPSASHGRDRAGTHGGRHHPPSHRRRPSDLVGPLALAAILVFIDQITKWLAVTLLGHGERFTLIPGFFDFTLVYNRGAAFSVLADAAGWQRWFLTAIGLGAAAFIVWLLARHGSQRLFAFALSLILAGALGNVIDRILHGQVTDFVLLYFRGMHWPAFNVADAAITIGAVLLVIDEVLRARRRR